MRMGGDTLFLAAVAELFFYWDDFFPVLGKLSCPEQRFLVENRYIQEVNSGSWSGDRTRRHSGLFRAFAPLAQTL